MVREVPVEVVVEKEVVKTVEVPVEVVKEVVKEVQVPGETIVVEKRGRQDSRGRTGVGPGCSGVSGCCCPSRYSRPGRYSGSGRHVSAGRTVRSSSQERPAVYDDVQGLRAIPIRHHVRRRHFHFQPGHGPDVVPTRPELGAGRSSRSIPTPSELRSGSTPSTTAMNSPNTAIALPFPPT